MEQRPGWPTIPRPGWPIPQTDAQWQGQDRSTTPPQSFLHHKPCQGKRIGPQRPPKIFNGHGAQNQREVNGDYNKKAIGARIIINSINNFKATGAINYQKGQNPRS
eukprot:EG_transcript_39547